MLYRGISSEEENTIRKEKLVDEKFVENQPLHIDGFNQILTIASYLNGNKVFISTDGFLRDASEIHGKIFRTELLERSVELIITCLDSMKLNDIVFYIDKQLNNHEQIEDYFSSYIRY